MTRSAGRRFQPGQSGNPAGRPPGSGQIGKLRQEIAEHVPEIVAKLVEQAKAGDSTAARLLLERALPAMKAVDPAEPIPLEGETLTAQGRAVLQAIGTGEVSASQGATLLGALAHLAKLTEADELEARIEALEARNGSGKGSA